MEQKTQPHIVATYYTNGGTIAHFFVLPHECSTPDFENNPFAPEYELFRTITLSIQKGRDPETKQPIYGIIYESPEVKELLDNFDTLEQAKEIFKFHYEDFLKKVKSYVEFFVIHNKSGDIH